MYNWNSVHVKQEPPGPPVPGLPATPPTFCLCDCDSSQYLTLVESHSICLFVLAYFMYCNALKVHPYSSICQNFLPKKAE